MNILPLLFHFGYLLFLSLSLSFFFFFCLNKSESGHPCLVPDFSRNSFTFFLLSIGCGFVINGFHYFLFVFCFLLFRTVPTAYGGSQARGHIRAVAAGLHHSHSRTRSELSLWPTHTSQQCWIPQPLSKAWDLTCIFMDTSWIRFHCAVMGTPWLLLCWDILSVPTELGFQEGVFEDAGPFLTVTWIVNERFESHLHSREESP